MMPNGRGSTCFVKKDESTRARSFAGYKSNNQNNAREGGSSKSLGEGERARGLSREAAALPLEGRRKQGRVYL